MPDVREAAVPARTPSDEGRGRVATADETAAAVERAQRALLEHPVRALAGRLAATAGEVESLVHGDFHAKNLVRTPDGRIVVVDWPGAHVHHHLGDLYCLAQEADRGGLGPGRAAELYAAATGQTPVPWRTSWSPAACAGPSSPCTG